jgi:riboflavin-specific deaminase-like protein
MPQPHVTLTTTSSLDGRTDQSNPSLLSNRLEDNRIQELRAKVDAVLTSAERIMQEDINFPIKDPRGPEPAIVVIDRDGNTPPEAAVFRNRSRKVILVTCKKASRTRIKKLQDARPDLVVMEVGEAAVNLEDMLWDLHRAGLRNILLEGDDALNMRMLDRGLIDEVYVLLAPMVLGQEGAGLFDSKFERRVDLQLEGILQFGDHVVLHYNVVRIRR